MPYFWKEVKRFYTLFWHPRNRIKKPKIMQIIFPTINKFIGQASPGFTHANLFPARGGSPCEILSRFHRAGSFANARTKLPSGSDFCKLATAKMGISPIF